MNILELEVDGFGVWSGLGLADLSARLNVFHGPNEAGKTTLVEFVRSMLYGFSPERRHRYLPPLRGGRPGGSLVVAGPQGRCRISRHADGPQGGLPAGDLRLWGPDGTIQGDDRLDILLGNVDEAIFNNVFAVGLREIQELNTLADTDAADLLYNLTTGLDRVSLADVLGELTGSRERLLAGGDRAGQVAALWAERERLRGEIHELGSLWRRYADLARQHEEIETQIARRLAAVAELEQAARVIELAITARGPWEARAALDAELKSLGEPAGLPHGAADQLDAAHARLASGRRRLARLGKKRAALLREAAGLEVKRAIVRHAPRIEALLEQGDWLATLETQVRQLRSELADSQEQVAAGEHEVGWAEETSPAQRPRLTESVLAALRPAAKALREPLARLQGAKDQMNQGRQAAEALGHQIRAALAGRQDKQLMPALERAGAHAAQLRRRIQLDERLAQMSRHEQDLQAQSRHLVDRQLLPLWVLVALGGLFALGVVLILAGLLLPESVVGPAGWALALLGLGGSATAGGAKFMLERAAAGQLEACQKQLGILGLQIKQAKEERDELDSRLPRGGGPLVTRLQAAEKELADLEDLLSLDARRQAAQQEAKSARARLAAAGDDWRKARRRWHEALAGAGLPSRLSPGQVRRLAARGERIEELRLRLERQRQELDGRRRELEALGQRVAQLMAEVGVVPAGDANSDRLRQLRQELAEQQALAKRRGGLLARAARLRRRQARVVRAVRQGRRQRREVLLGSGAASEQDFRHRAQTQARHESLRNQREALTREITAALGGRASEDAVRECLSGTSQGELEARWDELAGRVEAAQTELKALFEQRGQSNQEVQALADDRRLATRLVELGAVEQQLHEALDEWQVLAVTHQILESVRKTYEAERQPETLQEASKYLERLTHGHYTRVWTPLGDRALRVDDSAGNSLAVEVLSRGTREQLFLSLRLALAACYARRGAKLPLVLDDVLVNFDARRARAAAGLLRDFAAAGHQLLIFTCHDHLLKIFRSWKVPVRPLPDNANRSVPGEACPQPRRPGRQRGEPPQRRLLPAAALETADAAADLIHVEDDEAEEQLEHEAGQRSGGDGLDADRAEYLDETEAGEEADQALPRVTVVRSRRSAGPFAGTIWHEPVRDEAGDIDAA